MEKINFKDLPSTDTPIDSANLNLLQTNVENAINGTILYEKTGNNTSDIQLSDSVDNYKYIEIFGHEVGGRMVYTKIEKSNTFIGKKFTLECLFFTSATQVISRMSLYTIENNKLIPSGQCQLNLFTTGSNQIQSAASMSINKVVGYK